MVRCAYCGRVYMESPRDKDGVVSCVKGCGSTMFLEASDPGSIDDDALLPVITSGSVGFSCDGLYFDFSGKNVPEKLARRYLDKIGLWV